MAKEIYTAIKEIGQKGFIPVDNWEYIMESEQLIP